MSLEQAIADLTAAVKEQTTFMKSLQGKGSATAADKPAGTKPATAPKGTGGKKAVTLDTIKERFGAFLGVEDKKVRAKRIEAVTAMNEHFGVERATQLGEDQWAEALGYLDQLEAGETPNYMSEDAEDEGSGGSLV